MKAILALAILTAALLAGCSTPTTGPVTAEMKDGKYVIHMVGSHFNPANAKVPPGATVQWVNDESSPHDVTAEDNSWATPSTLQKGATYEHKFDAAGTVAYVCTIHESTGMTGTLTVA